MSEVVDALLAQHDRIRTLMAHCEQLADDLDAGKVEPSVVLAEVATLRLTLETHNRFEERQLRPILDDDAAIADHIDEHRSVSEHLGSPITRELRATLARLRHHLAVEERYFKSWSDGPGIA
jgi:hypothetical protein